MSPFTAHSSDLLVFQLRVPDSKSPPYHGFWNSVCISITISISIAISISNSRLMRLVSLSDSCQIVLILNEIVNTGRFEYPGSTCTLGLSLQNPYHYKIPQLGPPPCVPPAGATTTSRWGQYCVWDHHQFFFFGLFTPFTVRPHAF